MSTIDTPNTIHAFPTPEAVQAAISFEKDFGGLVQKWVVLREGYAVDEPLIRADERAKVLDALFDPAALRHLAQACFGQESPQEALDAMRDALAAALEAHRLQADEAEARQQLADATTRTQRTSAQCRLDALTAHTAAV